MLRFKDYSKSYNGNLIAAIPLLELPTGAYWLKGQNGTGKTTLLRSIAGIIPYKGNITLRDVDVRKQAMDYRRMVSYAAAEPLYPSFLTGDDLIRFYLQTKGGTQQEAQALVQQLGAHNYLHNKVGTYSSGMLKKLSLILAFVGQPKLVMLDEPLITLDQAAVEMLYGIMSGYYRDGNMLLVTSHQEVVIEGMPMQQLAIHNKTVAKV